jgi:hypothetical protein
MPRTHHEEIRDGAASVRDLLRQASTAITEASARSRAMAQTCDADGTPFERFTHAIRTQIDALASDLDDPGGFRRDPPLNLVVRDAEDLVALVDLASEED